MPLDENFARTITFLNEKVCEHESQETARSICHALMDAFVKGDAWIPVIQAQTNTPECPLIHHDECYYDYLPAFALVSPHGKLFLTWIHPAFRDTDLEQKMVHSMRNMRNRLPHDFDSYYGDQHK